MKGIIAKCLKDMVVEKFGEKAWNDILVMSGMEKGMMIVSMGDLDDAVVLKMIESTCKVLGVSMAQAADVFGEYWVCHFAPKIYSAYYAGVETAKDFLLKMDEVHKITTSTIPNARPPRFEYRWESPKVLIMHYKSKRNLIDILVGLVKGVGKYFNTPLNVKKISNSSIQVIFP